jgi:pilus assembly protein CpaB
MARRSVALIVSDGTAQSADTVQSPVALGAVYPGQQLVSQQFGQADGRQVSGVHGERTVISVEFADPEQVAGSVEAGSWVAIFVSEDPEPHLADGSARKLPPLTRILLPKVQVLSIGEPTDALRAQSADDTDPSMPAYRTTLTIAVTETEAEKVICSSRNGDLTFALRGDRSQAVNRPQNTSREIAPALYGSAS